MSAWIQSGIAVIVAGLSYIWLHATQKRQPKREGTRIAWMPIALFLVCVMGAVGFSLYLGLAYVWEFTAVIAVLAVLYRILVVPRLKEKPNGIQSLIEAGVAEAMPVQRKPENPKSAKRLRFLQKALFLGSLWFAFGRIMTAVYGTAEGQLNVELFPETVKVFGLSLSRSIVDVWGIIAVMTVLAILFRVFVVPRFTDKPGKLQNLVETSIEAIGQYTHGKLHVATDALACYMFTIALLMIGSALIELIGLRPPTADLKLTLSMALITFIMINYYGIKEKGLIGRIKSMAQPKAFILPIRLLTDLAVPVSLGCRLFGNMLGGMVVMDLLKMALGANGIGVPSIAGLYFNIFHPLIQTYIFITLSLTFINEAVE